MVDKVPGPSNPLNTGISSNGPPTNIATSDQGLSSYVDKPSNGLLSLSNFTGANINYSPTFRFANFAIPFPRLTIEVYRNPGTMSTPKLYQVLFLKKKKLESKSKIRRTIDSDRVVELDIVTLNYSLFKKDMQFYQRWKEDQTTEDPLSWEKFSEMWSVDGVVVTEEGQEDINSFPSEFGKDRLFNVITKGRANAINIWGSKCRQGTALYFIYKRMDISEKKFLLHPTTQLKTKNPVQSEEEDAYKNMPFQMVPYASYEHEYPPFSETRYLDPYKKKYCYGKIIYFGRVESNTNLHKSSERNMSVTTDINDVLSQPQILIHVDIQVL